MSATLVGAVACAALFSAPFRPAVAPLRVHVTAAVDPFGGAELDMDAIKFAQASMEAKADEAEAVEAAAEEAASWRALEDILPAAPESPAPVLTLYRDTNGWCPFCERVWVQLRAKGIPYREELVDLRDKPAWYKEMVPTALVPAVKFDSDGAIVWESVDVMHQVEERFPEAPMLPTAGTEARARADQMMASCADVLQAGVRMSYPNASATDDERAATLKEFEAQLTAVDADVAAGGGPWMLGDSFTLVDAMFIPMMERWAVQVSARARHVAACVWEPTSCKPCSHAADMRQPNPPAFPDMARRRLR